MLDVMNLCGLDFCLTKLPFVGAWCCHLASLPAGMCVCACAYVCACVHLTGLYMAAIGDRQLGLCLNVACHHAVVSVSMRPLLQ